MFIKNIFAVFILGIMFTSAFAQTKATDTVLVLPFENTSGKGVSGIEVSAG